jgi:hypothetical protein
MKDIQGKRILFIAPRFFGYEIDIKNEVEKRGAHVDYLPDRPFDKPWQVAITKFFPNLIQPWITRYYYKKLKLFSKQEFDIILVINGQTIEPKFLDFLKVQYPKTQSVLYMWDSMDNKPGIVNTLKFYDSAFCFDFNSATKYGMKFRPTFFTPGFTRLQKSSYKYNLSFIGTMHSDRYEILCKIRSQLAGDIKTYWYFYLQAPWVYAVYRLLKASMREAPIRDFKFKPLGRTEVHEVFEDTQVILDIEHPQQRGLTMRAFEAMGANKKLITTNADTQNYDFFRPENVCIIDRKNPIIPISFFNVGYQPPSQEIYYKYSLAGWLDEILADLK